MNHTGKAVVLFALALAGSPARAQTVLCGSMITDAVKCGTQTVTDGVRCGTQTVTDAVQCGTQTVTDGAKCGWDTVGSCVTGVFTQGSTSDCKKAKTCTIANTCSVPKSCQVPKSCAQTSPCGAPTAAVDIFRHAEPGGQSTCRPPSDETQIAGCCGAPGIHGCIVGADLGMNLSGACTGPLGNTLLMDPYTSPPAPLCNLPVPSCGPGIPQALSGSGDTIYVTSDLHLFRGWVLEDHIAHVKVINDFAAARQGWKAFLGLPTSDGDLIAPPRAIVVNGDVTLDSSAGNLGAYRMLWEQGRHPQSIRYPVFYGLGNHDNTTQVASALAAQRMFDYLTADMNCPGISMDLTRPSTVPTVGGTVNYNVGQGLGLFGGVVPQSAVQPTTPAIGSGNYSWDFGNVHHVQLNVWAGDQGSLYQHHSDGLAWLANDLASSVGQSGRPVVLHQHIELTTLAAGDLANLWKAVRDYNVIGLFAGHIHAAEVQGAKQLTDSAGNPKRLDVFVSSTGGADSSTHAYPGGSPGHGDFIVARVSDHYLDVGHVSWAHPANGNGITLGTLADEQAIDGGSPGYYGGPGAKSCRKRINDRIDPLTGVTVAQQKSGSTLAVTLTLPQGAAAIAGPVALRADALPNSNSLTNRSFVDGCSPAATPAPSPYLLLADADLARLNQHQPVTLSLTFANDPGSQTVSLVTLTPLSGAAPAQVVQAAQATAAAVTRLVGGTRLVAGNGKCLDYDGGTYQSKVNGGKIQAWDCNGQPNQVWTLRQGRLLAGNGKCVDIDRGAYDNKQNGGTIQAWDCNGGPNQQWTLDGGQLKAQDGMCLDYDGGTYGTRVDPGKIQLWQCNGQPNQRWQPQ